MGRWVCRWQDAESRNDAEVVANVKLMRELMGDEQALREVQDMLAAAAAAAAPGPGLFVTKCRSSLLAGGAAWLATSRAP